MNTEKTVMEYVDYLAALKNDHPNVAGEIGSFRNLEQVLDWMKNTGRSLADLDMITQDEFCHDLILPLDQEGRHLVFAMS